MEDFDGRYFPHALLKQMVLVGRLGKRMRKGFYDYNK
jgi:3-hydroxyacyl-CoA dehydrogenase